MDIDLSTPWRYRQALDPRLLTMALINLSLWRLLNYKVVWAYHNNTIDLYDNLDDMLCINNVYTRLYELFSINFD